MMLTMGTILTARQARLVTSGRTPLVPLEYEAAVRSLSQCTTLDESKYWRDKADALAAWAKIHHSNEILRKAKALKLHAFRRMGELSAELNPRKPVKNGRGSIPGSGPRSLLKRHGLSEAEADAARMLAQMPEKRFEKLLKRPIAPTTLRYLRQADEAGWHEIARTAMSLRSVFRRHTPAQAVLMLSVEQRMHAREMMIELTEWLDEFNERLDRKMR